MADSAVESTPQSTAQLESDIVRDLGALADDWGYAAVDATLDPRDELINLEHDREFLQHWMDFDDVEADKNIQVNDDMTGDLSPFDLGYALAKHEPRFMHLSPSYANIMLNHASGHYEDGDPSDTTSASHEANISGLDVGLEVLDVHAAGDMSTSRGKSPLNLSKRRVRFKFTPDQESSDDDGEEGVDHLSGPILHLEPPLELHWSDGDGPYFGPGSSMSATSSCDSASSDENPITGLFDQFDPFQIFIHDMPVRINPYSEPHELEIFEADHKCFYCSETFTVSETTTSWTNGLTLLCQNCIARLAPVD